MAIFGSFAPQTNETDDFMAQYYNPKAAKWNAVGNALQGLGTGLMTRDWAKAAEVQNAGMDDYQNQVMKKAQMAQFMKAAQDKQQERAQAEEERKRKTDFIKTLPPDQQMKALSIPGYLEKLVSATDPALQGPQELKRYNVGGSLVDANGNVIYQDKGNSNVGAQIDERRTAAQAIGLTPDNPAYQSYILTGKMPREDQAPLTATDKKAILEADDAVQANTNTIGLLQSVLKVDPTTKLSLNDRAGSGVFAGAQAVGARNDPTGGWIFDKEQGQATTDLQNIILNQALGSLKSIFGGNPTEGERAILLDLQASVDKTPAERKAIVERAITAANARLQFNKQRADSLRGETYYKPGGAPKSITTPDGYTIEPVE